MRNTTTNNTLPSSLKVVAGVFRVSSRRRERECVCVCACDIKISRGVIFWEMRYSLFPLLVKTLQTPKKFCLVQNGTRERLELETRLLDEKAPQIYSKKKSRTKTKTNKEREREIQRERERVREIREKTGDVCFTHLLFFVCVFFFEFFKVAFIATTTKKK